MLLTDLYGRIHRKILKLRSVESLVNSPRFARLWADSTDEQQEEALKDILDGSRLALVQWMRAHPSLALGERNMEYLRMRGKQMRIKNYSRLAKHELIRVIKLKEDTYEQKQESDA